MASSVGEGYLKVTGLEPTDLEQSATVIIPGEERRDTAMVAWYRLLGSSVTVLWIDPAVFDQVADLASGSAALSQADFERLAADRGAELLGRGCMRTLAEGHDNAVSTVPDGYRHERLRSGEAADMARIQHFVDGSDADDVEEAALDELDDFADDQIHVLSQSSEGSGPDPIVAYASAAAWDWDASLGDIGVLVSPEHRHRGLGRWVVNRCSQGLVADGRAPLYRHDPANAASAALATSLGFVPEIQLAVWRLPTGSPA